MVADLCPSIGCTTFTSTPDAIASDAAVLHAEAFETRLYNAAEWDWESLVRAHSLGWVTARSATELVGFVNVIWGGLVHAWIQNEMVASSARRRWIGQQLTQVAAQGARESLINGAIGPGWA